MQVLFCVLYWQLTALTESINSILEHNRLPSYYAEPRFHVSIAWWIPPSLGSDSHPNEVLPASTLRALEEQYGEVIRETELGVESVLLKVGKDVTRFAFV